MNYELEWVTQRNQTGQNRKQNKQDQAAEINKHGDRKLEWITAFDDIGRQPRVNDTHKVDVLTSH